MDYIEVDFHIEPKYPATDILIAVLGEAGFDSFQETEQGVLAYIPKKDFSEAMLSGLDILPGIEVKYTIKIIEAVNWNKEWESNFQPVEVEDQCIVRATFHDPKPEFPFEIVIQPKMSFGTGHHQTTWLMIKAMLDNKEIFKNKSVLDMGSGTGILAILAEKLGSKTIEAIDIDEWAYENCLENLHLNDSGNIKVAMGDAKLLQDNKFDCILANINRNVLVSDLPIYKKSLKKNAHLFLSGFFVTDNPVLEEKAESLGFEIKARMEKENWSLLHFILK
jgi:ribosomal protein L11 methyltransferase